MLAADSSENADKIKSLLDFSQKLESADAGESAVSEAADEFLKGDDKMKVHRQIFIANRLLENKKALPKVLELTKAAVGGVDSAMEAANPAAAILADELYDSRTFAIIRGQLIIVPDVPRQTLLNILRGRIEDISGWALYQQGKTGEAVIRLKRAVSVLPEKARGGAEVCGGSARHSTRTENPKKHSRLTSKATRTPSLMLQNELLSNRCIKNSTAVLTA